MKTFCLTILIGVLQLIWAKGIQAQTNQTNLNQTELMKYFIGSWKYDWGKDSTGIQEMKPFGTGLEGYWNVVINGKIVSETKELYGYDKKTDKYLCVELTKGQDIAIYAMWFISNNKCIGIPYSDIANPDKPSFKYEYEIKSPNAFTYRWFNNGKTISGSVTFTRTK